MLCVQFQRYLEFPVNSERIDAEIQILRENPDCKLPRFTNWEQQLPVERKIKYRKVRITDGK